MILPRPIRRRRVTIITGCVAAAILAGLAARAVVPSGASPHAADVPEPPKATVDSGACARCHSCDHPTASNPCLLPCPRHGEHFYGTHEVDEGPDVVIIDQIADLYRPVVFAHRLHAKMSAFSGGCRNCHHYSENDGKIPACRKCHDAASNQTDLRKPALKGAYHRQCINCHLDWRHENACAFCHLEAAGREGSEAAPDQTDIVGIPHPLIEATPSYLYETDHEDAPYVTFHHQDHVEAFGLDCVDCHQGDSCNRCHDTSDQPPARLDHVTSCFTCHFERDCGFCHTLEPQPRFHHTESASWPLNPYHGEVACTVCHDKPDAFRVPEPRCVSCHIHWEDGKFDHAVTGIALNEDHEDADCVDCHVDLDFTRVPYCQDCHDDPMWPGKPPGKQVEHKQPMIPKR